MTKALRRLKAEISLRQPNCTTDEQFFQHAKELAPIIGAIRKDRRENDRLWRDLIGSGIYPDRYGKLDSRAKTNYRTSGYKYTEVLLAAQRESEQETNFYSAVIDLGIRPLFQKNTVEIAKSVLSKLFEGFRYIYKIERNNSRASYIHAHACVLLPLNFEFTQRVDDFNVKYRALGIGKPEYKDMSLYDNLSYFVRYFQDAPDSRGDKKTGRAFINEALSEILFQWIQAEAIEKARKDKKKAPLYMSKSEIWDKNVRLRGVSKALDQDLRAYRTYFQQHEREEIEARYKDAPTLRELAEAQAPARDNVLLMSENPLRTASHRQKTPVRVFRQLARSAGLSSLTPRQVVNVSMPP